MKVTMADVADLANVSITTVSHVINGSRKVAEETSNRVKAAIDDLNYSVDSVAQNLRRGNSKIIGFIINNMSNEFYINIGLGLRSVLAPAGYKISYLNSIEDQETEKQNIKDLISHAYDGLIIAPTSNDCAYMNKLIPKNRPVVFVDRKPRGFERDSVLVTNQKGVEDATSILIQKGHRRIAFIGSRRNDTMSERLEGYKTALFKASIPFDESLVLVEKIEPSTMMDILSGVIFSKMDGLLGKKPTAIVSGNGMATIGIINSLKKHRLQIPDDIALISFDNHFWYELLSPGITAVFHNPFEIGVQAGVLLLRRLKKEDFPYQNIRIPTQIIARESC